MRKSIYLLIAGALIALASCSKLEDIAESPEQSSRIATFTVESPTTTRATVNGLSRYIVEAYEGKDLTTEPVRAESSTGTLTLTLKKETDYSFLFWADKGVAKTQTTPSNGYWNTAKLQEVAVSAGKESTPGEAAYCLAIAFNSKDFEANKIVSLRNATTQVNFIETAGLASTDNTLTVKYSASATLNVGTGKIKEVSGDVSHTFTGIAKEGKNTTLATDYVLAPLDEQHLMDLKVQFNSEEEKSITNVPFRQNYKTNIKGEYSNLYASTFDVSKVEEDYTQEDFTPEPANVISNNTQAEVPQGEGTPTNPYLIKSGANIKWMQKYAAGYVSNDKYYRLETDIEVTADIWTPIGVEENYQSFYGNFDGNNHKVTGKLAARSDYGPYCFGFFGQIGVNGTIKNFTNSAEVHAPNTLYVGGIAGLTFGKIEGCSNTAKITGKAYVGGIAGYYSNANEMETGTVSILPNCNNSGEIVAFQKNDKNEIYAGGIVGRCYLQPKMVANNSTIFLLSACTNTGNVSAPANSQYVGGIIGQPAVVYGTCKIKNCTNSGIIKAGEATANANIGNNNNENLGLLVGGQYTGYSGTTVIEQ